MDTRNHGREDRPLDTNPDEVHQNQPGKQIKAQEKIDIVQSGFGREQGQTPADEHIESRLSQIDEGTKKIHESELEDESETGTARDTAGYMNDTTSADRDTGNDTGGWEESRTARHK